LTIASRRLAQCIECGTQLPREEAKASEFEAIREEVRGRE
jgi:hypothetical protein